MKPQPVGETPKEYYGGSSLAHYFPDGTFTTYSGSGMGNNTFSGNDNIDYSNILNTGSTLFSTVSAGPTMEASWTYNNNGKNVRWVSKNGKTFKFPKTSRQLNIITYKRGINFASNASRVSRIAGNAMGGAGFLFSSFSVGYNMYTGVDNTSDWVNWGINGGTLLMTHFGGTYVGTAGVVIGLTWSIGQIYYGNEINGWINDNYGYR